MSGPVCTSGTLSYLSVPFTPSQGPPSRRSQTRMTSSPVTGNVLQSESLDFGSLRTSELTITTRFSGLEVRRVSHRGPSLPPSLHETDRPRDYVEDLTTPEVSTTGVRNFR